MNIVQLSILSGSIACLAATGCAAADSASFRAMAATDHERVASTGGDAAPAEEHLAAARELRERERSACAEVPDVDRDQGPFARRDRIVATKELRARLFPKAPEQTVGVSVEIRATPGTTEQWLGRIVQCHLAHYAVVGGASADPGDPLTTPGARVSVAATQVGFRVAITSPSSEVARQLLEKGLALSAKGT
jgi:hypothetical protein